jgi:hypothetical protein
MKKFVVAAATAVTLGFAALTANPASAAVSPLNPIAVEQTQSAGKTAKHAGLIQEARRRGGGWGGGRHWGGRHRGHRGHRWHRWGGYGHVYYGGCFVRKIWTDYGPVYRRICRW